MTRDEELASLRQKLDKSRYLGPGYTARCEAIEARIKQLEADANANGS